MGEPIRVLHIVTYMGRGGLETMLMNYYRQIDRSRVQFDFLAHRDFEADYDGEILALGGRIYRLPQLNPFSPGYLKALDSFFAQHKEYKIVHSHLDCMAGIPLKYAKKHGVPVRIAHAHNSNQTKDKKYLLKLLFKRSIPRNASQLFACSQMAGEWMFNRATFRVMNNAIDAKAYTFDPTVRMQVYKELGINPDSLLVGHVGRFEPQKNHQFLLRIFAALPQNARLLLVGDGTLRQQTEAQAKELGIQDRVIFAGVRKDIPRLLQAMDVFLFPSNYEGLPVSIIEAQAAGLPCLISDKVPLECKKTDLVEQIALAESPEHWAARVLEAAKLPRADRYEDIKKAGFDIAANAQWLQEFYENEG